MQRVRAYASRLERVFGWRFLVFLLCSQALLKGALLYVVGGVMLPIYKNVLGVDAAALQFYSMLTMTAWSIKPLLGLLSDYVAVDGYHKRPWLLLSLVVGCVGMACSFLAYVRRSALGIAACFACVQLEVALFDLATEAVYSARMRDHDAQEPDPDQRTGSDIVTLAQTLQTAGGLLATLFVGTAADHGAYMALLWVAMACCAVPVVPTLLGWITEHRDEPPAEGMPTYMRGHVTVTAVGDNRGIVCVVAFMGIAAPVTALLVSVGDPAIAFAIASLFCTAAVTGAYFVFPRVVAHVAAYQVLRNVSGPSLGSALDYFFVADDACVPGGPHFTLIYYMTVVGVIGYGSTVAGGIAYQVFMSRMRFRSVLLVTTVLSSLAGASDLFIVTRANIALGIPDKAAYIMGEAIVEPVLGMLNWIPISALLAKVVPHGMEGSTFAFLAGVGNFSSMIRELSGALLFDVAGVETTVPCDFRALPWLVLVCHIVSPLVVGVAVSWLIPNKPQTDDLNAPEPMESDVEFSHLVSA